MLNQFGGYWNHNCSPRSYTMQKVLFENKYKASQKYLTQLKIHKKQRNAIMTNYFLKIFWNSLNVFVLNFYFQLALSMLLKQQKSNFACFSINFEADLWEWFIYLMLFLCPTELNWYIWSFHPFYFKYAHKKMSTELSSVEQAGHLLRNPLQIQQFGSTLSNDFPTAQL